jgi:hypothetical protein
MNLATNMAANKTEPLEAIKPNKDQTKLDEIASTVLRGRYLMIKFFKRVF